MFGKLRYTKKELVQVDFVGRDGKGKHKSEGDFDDEEDSDN